MRWRTPSGTDFQADPVQWAIAAILIVGCLSPGTTLGAASWILVTILAVIRRPRPYGELVDRQRNDEDDGFGPGGSR